MSHPLEDYYEAAIAEVEQKLSVLQGRYDRLAKDYSDLVPGQGEMAELEQLRRLV